MEKPNGLELIASLTIEEYKEFYKVVDFLNRTLKDKNIVFGLKKHKDTKKMTIYIYNA